MAGNIQWTDDLGNAFLAQQSDVMDAVQRMRGKAESKGTLKTSAQQTVQTKTVEGGKQAIVIEQAQPERKRQSLPAAAVPAGGLLVLGWNADLVADPSMLMGITRHFGASRDAELVDPVTFRYSTHTFDFYARRWRPTA